MIVFPVDYPQFSPVHTLSKHVATPKRTVAHPLMDITNKSKTPKKTTITPRSKARVRQLNSPFKRLPVKTTTVESNLAPKEIEPSTIITHPRCMESCFLLDQRSSTNFDEGPSGSNSELQHRTLTSCQNTPNNRHTISLAGSSPPRHPQPVLEPSSTSEPVNIPSTSKFQDAFLLRSMFTHLRLFGADTLLNLFIGWTFFHVVHNSTTKKRSRALSMVPSMESNAHELLLLQTWRTFVAIMLTNLVQSTNSHLLALLVVDIWNISLLFVDYGPVVVFAYGWVKQQLSSANFPKVDEPQEEEEEEWNPIEYLDSWMFLIHHVLFCKPLIVARLIAYLILASINPSVLGIPYLEINPNLFQPSQLNLWK